MKKIKVLVSGACGKMGKEVIKAISQEENLELVGAVDLSCIGQNIGTLCHLPKVNLPIQEDLASTIKASKAEVVVDFTHPDCVMKNIKNILNNKVHAVIGTTGISEGDLNEIRKLCTKNVVNCIVAPNFAIGAILMMKFAKEAYRYMPKAEIIELHHDQKKDAPSGTAIKTAQLMVGDRKKIPIHSVRLPGLVAHQEVIFGGVGQTLTIRHDTINRESFMPGVVLAVRKVKNIKGLIYGLENLL